LLLYGVKLMGHRSWFVLFGMPRKATTLQEMSEAILSLAADARKLQSYKALRKSSSYPADSKWSTASQWPECPRAILIAPEAIKNPAFRAPQNQASH
jgi:hypothetical protein